MERPDYGSVTELEAGVRMILAPNPSPMTHWGTNTYVLGTGTVVVVVVGVVVWIGGRRSCEAGSVVPQATPTRPSTPTVAAISVRSGRLMARDARRPTPPTARAGPSTTYCRES